MSMNDAYGAGNADPQWDDTQPGTRPNPESEPAQVAAPTSDAGVSGANPAPAAGYAGYQQYGRPAQPASAYSQTPAYAQPAPATVSYTQPEPNQAPYAQPVQPAAAVPPPQPGAAYPQQSAPAYAYPQPAYGQPVAPQPSPQQPQQPTYPQQPVYPQRFQQAVPQSYPSYPSYPQPVYGQPPVAIAQPMPVPMAVPVFAPIDPRAWWRTWRRKVVNRAMGLTLAYQAVMTGVGIVAGLVFAVIYGAMDPNGGDAGYNAAADRWTGIMSLITVLCAFGFLLLMRHRDIFTREFWLGGAHRNTYGEPNQLGTISQYGGRRMTPLACLAIIVISLGVQGVIVLIQLAFSMLGTDLASPTSESISESAITVSMWLYIGLIGPICEEVMFRGVLMKELKPLGRNFAIVTSALVFGLFHDDLVQGFFAFLFGLVLGYVAMEYSLIWSIALHIFNNAILSGVVDELAGRFLSDTGYGIFSLVLALVGVIGSIIVFIVAGRELGRYLHANRSQPDTCYGWTSWALIVFVALNAIYTIISFIFAMLGQ